MSATGEPPRNDLTGTWIVTALRGVTRFFRHDPRTGIFFTLRTSTAVSSWRTTASHSRSFRK
jgi:hypothetical protein